ncbi:MAG: hypothetical protein MUF72_03005 [Elainella sp. Prado103]|nr:hypothetical protein [Elainella sp. Prado103]
MASSSPNSRSTPPPIRLMPRRSIPRPNRYFWLWLGTNLAIWSTALFYVTTRPVTYTSRWSANVPFSTNYTNVNLPGIGAASASADSPYKTFADPRESYKLLAESDEVLTAAAAQLQTTPERFGKPRIKVVDNTTLMNFEIRGETPEIAQQKAVVLSQALEQKLQALRLIEMQQQDRHLKLSLGSDQARLQTAQENLSGYRTDSPLVSGNQLTELTMNLEGLRRSQAEAVAELQQVTAKVQQLSASLSLTSEQAAAALALQSDQLFQAYLAEYNQASTALASESTRFQPTSPVIRDKQQRVDAAKLALLQQGQVVLGRPVTESTLTQLILSGGGGSSSSASERARLFQELIALQTQQQGAQAQAQALTEQVTQLEARLASLAQQESQLENLERDVKISEAVFSSNLTKLSVNRADISASYPQMTIVTQPSLPKAPSLPRMSIATLLGAALGSVFLTTAVLSLWLRDRQIRKMQQTELTPPPFTQPHSIQN